MKWWFGRILYHFADGYMKIITTTIVLYIIYTKTTPEIPLNWIIGIMGMFWVIYPLIENIFANESKEVKR